MAVGIVITGVAPANGKGYLVQDVIPDFTGLELIVDGIATLSGSYGTASSHGDTFSFSGVALPPNIGAYAPTWARFWELVPAGTALTGYQFTYCPGPTLAAPTLNGGVLQITGTGAASGQGGTEITEGSAYSSYTPSLDGTKLKFRFYFVKQ